ncbi:MAG: helix-turn-helix domain-containing protein [Candidatus Sedimenticola sp. (ex Thyasira tokunagai)]
MKGKQILQSLKTEGLTFTDIANTLGVSPVAISNVAHRKTDSARIASALALAIGKPVDKIFPDKPTYHRKPIDPKQREQRINALREQFGQAATA